MPIYTPSIRISSSPVRNPSPKKKTSSAADGHVRPSAGRVRRRPPPPLRRCHVGARPLRRRRPGRPRRGPRGPDPPRRHPPPLPRARRRPPPPTAAAPPRALVAGELPRAPEPASSPGAAPSDALRRHAPPRVAGSGPRRPPPPRRRATPAPLHLSPAAAPSPASSVAARSDRERVATVNPSAPPLTFSLSHYIFLATLTACISATVAPFWAYDISKSSPRHVHHFIPLHHLHLRSS